DRDVRPVFFFSSRRRHTRSKRDWSSDVCSSDLGGVRTLFRMPDLLSLGLGGGSLVSDDGAAVGPRSVGYRLVEDGRVFGGATLRSEERRVGKECRGRWARARCKSRDVGLQQYAY